MKVSLSEKMDAESITSSACSEKFQLPSSAITAPKIKSKFGQGIVCITKLYSILK